MPRKIISFFSILLVLGTSLFAQSADPDATTLISHPMATKIYTLAHKYPSSVATVATLHTISTMEADRLLYQLDPATAADFLVALAEDRSQQEFQQILEKEGYFTKPEQRYALQVVQLRPRQRKVGQMKARERIVTMPKFDFDYEQLYEALAVGDAEVSLRFALEVSTSGSLSIVSPLDTLPPRLAEVATEILNGVYQHHPPQPAKVSVDGKTSDLDTFVILQFQVLHPLLSPNENSGVCVAYVERDKGYDPWTMKEADTRQLSQRLGLSERHTMMSINNFLNSERAVAHKSGTYRIRFVAHANELQFRLDNTPQHLYSLDPTYTLLSAVRQ